MLKKYIPRFPSCSLTGNAVSSASSAITLQTLLPRKGDHNPSWENEGKKFDLVNSKPGFTSVFVWSFPFKL